MERPYRFGTDHARFRQVANLLRREASATGCIIHTSRAALQRLGRLGHAQVKVWVPTCDCIGRGEDAIPHRQALLYTV